MPAIPFAEFDTLRDDGLRTSATEQFWSSIRQRPSATFHKPGTYFSALSDTRGPPKKTYSDNVRG